MLSYYRHVGNDVFISYSHSGAEYYAASLASKLGNWAYYPFYAGAESKPVRQSLEDRLSRALRRSQILVLIGEPVAFKSQWVTWEIKTFAENKPNAVLITISIGRALQDSDLSGTPFQGLRERVYLSEDAEVLRGGQPSLQVLEQIHKTLTSVNKRSARRRIFYVAVAAVILAFVAGLVVGKSLP
jgi:MTH538 TIR-like domain (DUF1863)